MSLILFGLGLAWLIVMIPLFLVLLLAALVVGGLPALLVGMIISLFVKGPLPWIVAAIALYVVVVVIGIAFYAPALKRQIAEAEADATSPAYAVAARRSNLFGISTTAVVLVIVVLMVTKPF